jgi:hypothetical protein
LYPLRRRYEDLEGHTEERARMVYARIGAPPPEAVLREARVHDGCVNGGEGLRAQCRADRDAMAQKDDGSPLCESVW